jgi:dipeptidyl aminopeptidase/acylaminoacyl peptidase
VYAAKDNRLHGIDLTTGEQWAVSPEYEGVAAPAISPCGRFVTFLCEQAGHCNVLLSDIRGRDLPVRLSDNPWYAFNPAFSPDGARLAWQEWDEADMPWDQARLQIALLARPTGQCAAAYAALPLHITTLGRPRVSYGSPQFSPDGQHLAFVSDETGWRSLWVAEADGRQARRADAGPGEVGSADWAPGNIAMRWSDDGGSLFAVRHYQSRDHLIQITWPQLAVREIPTAALSVCAVCTRGDEVAFVGAGPVQPPVLATLHVPSGRETPRATGAVGLLDAASLSQPEVLSWPTVGGADCWGILFRAVGPEADPARGPRPLMVEVHGGPTSEATLNWRPQAQYFATRGWHYLLVNHRGGTGFGRAYQDLLNGQWGVVDIEDARSGAEHLVGLGLADTRRLVITGGSAGGYTTLMALARQPDFWAAGISLFGVGDLYELKRGAHRFEVNYETGLIGPLPETGPLWRQRSPLAHVQNVRAPVLLFHGTDDKVVPHQQSVDFCEAVRRQGGIAELVSYEGEGHGFLKEANRKDVVERMERFLDKYVVCLQR